MAELGLGIVLNILMADNNFWKQVEILHLKTATIALYTISYAVTIFFIVLFYKRYKAISVTDNASTLMKNILKTRKVVKYYIIFILASSGVTCFVVFIFTLLYSEEFSKIRESIDWTKAIAIGLVTTLILVGLLWVIYSLIYGILLRKLSRNYKEIKRLEL
jgi:predicted branched-subunit amino acid permease